MVVESQLTDAATAASLLLQWRRLFLLRLAPLSLEDSSAIEVYREGLPSSYRSRLSSILSVVFLLLLKGRDCLKTKCTCRRNFVQTVLDLAIESLIPALILLLLIIGEVMGGILRSAVQGIAGGIGLVSESITVYRKSSKDKNNALNNNEDSNSNAQRPSLDQSIHEPPACQRSPAVSPSQEQLSHSKFEDYKLYKEERGNTEEQWDLDEAQEELNPPRYDSAQVQSHDVSQIVSSFVTAHPPPPYTLEAGGGRARLTHPVILPQRRPKARSRGFIRAYAPVLEPCGIDQAMFLGFLDTFEKASQASPWLNTINLAGIGTMFIPGVAGFLTGAAIQLSVSVAMEVQARSR